MQLSPGCRVNAVGDAELIILRARSASSARTARPVFKGRFRAQRAERINLIIQPRRFRTFSQGKRQWRSLSRSGSVGNSTKGARPEAFDRTVMKPFDEKTRLSNLGAPRLARRKALAWVR